MEGNAAAVTVEVILGICETLLSKILALFTIIFNWAITNPVTSIFIGLAILGALVGLGFMIYNNARH